MPILEYDANGAVIPPIVLESQELNPNDPKTEVIRFKWSDTIGNKIKKDVVVFKHGKVEELLKWQESIIEVLTEQKVTNYVDIIAATIACLATQRATTTT